MSKELKTNSAWTLQGQCLQYYNRECKLSINEKNVLSTLLDRSFAFKKRWCYLRYSDFDITNSSSLKKTLDGLVEKKIISYKNTYSNNGQKALNEYKILEPRIYIDKFNFIKESKDDSVKQKTANETSLYVARVGLLGREFADKQ